MLLDGLSRLLNHNLGHRLKRLHVERRSTLVCGRHADDGGLLKFVLSRRMVGNGGLRLKRRCSHKLLSRVNELVNLLNGVIELVNILLFLLCFLFFMANSKFLEDTFAIGATGHTCIGVLHKLVKGILLLKCSVIGLECNNEVDAKANCSENADKGTNFFCVLLKTSGCNFFRSVNVLCAEVLKKLFLAYRSLFLLDNGSSTGAAIDSESLIDNCSATGTTSNSGLLLLHKLLQGNVVSSSHVMGRFFIVVRSWVVSFNSN